MSPLPILTAGKYLRWRDIGPKGFGVGEGGARLIDRAARFLFVPSRD